MKNLFIGMSILITILSCSKEECITCIAESKSGVIIDTRLACDNSSRYLKGFAVGFSERFKDTDSVNVHCAYSY